MGWPFEKMPTEKPLVAAVLGGHGKVHAWFAPFGYPIRLCVWAMLGEGNQLEDRPEVTCRHCLRDLRRLEAL